MRIHHLGIAVKSIDQAMEVYRRLFPELEAEMEPMKEGAPMKMMIIKTDTGPLLELMEPIDPQGDVGRFITKRGEGIHHIAYAVEDICAAWSDAREKGMRVLGEIKVGAGGYRTFFIHPKDVFGVLTEYVGK